MINRNILQHCQGQPEQLYDAGETLLEEGASSDGYLLILVSGVVEIVKNGDVAVATVSEPGSPLGEMSLLVRSPHSATARAVTPVRCLRIPDGYAFLHAHPEVLFAIARLLALRLCSATAYLADVKKQVDTTDEASLALLDQVLETLIQQAGRTGEASSGDELTQAGPG
jgi:CRP/FNR family cyclic AMP-dependent transcriptional regulator